MEIFSKIEEQILNFWQKNKIFEKTLAKESPKGNFVFYDGPPFATGTPHYGHVVASLMKDVIPRFWTMKGYHVERKWGWDCHGLPIENLIEKELNLKSKKDIEEFGIDKFNMACETSVLRYANVWKKFIPRIGRWVDMERDYRTMDLNYMESIWWIFKTLWEKGLIYEDYKAMHICPRCETTLSNFEVTQGYTDLKDLAVVVKFKLKAGQKINKFVIDENTYVLAWTTTPWTLPGNVALAVKPEEDYAIIKIKESESNYVKSGESLIIMNGEPSRRTFGLRVPFEGSGFSGPFSLDVPDGKKVIGYEEKIKGKNLVGLEYEPLFDFYKDTDLKNKENGWKIYPAEFVSIEEGTGVVHIAPAFGEDDMNLGKQFNLPFIQHVDFSGKFKKEITLWAGEPVKPKGDHLVTDRKIVEWLLNQGKLFSKEEITHSYPLCWRCDTPLLNYAASSWFVRVTALKDKIIKNNEKINWIPHHIKHGRFGKWLLGARDWAISRSRYWGDPLPVWKCEGEGKRQKVKGKSDCNNIKVVGSIRELEELSSRKINNLHKHVVDKIVFKCEKCGGEMHRIPEVLDCWFESGSMPYAQLHYPFENKELIDCGKDSSTSSSLYSDSPWDDKPAACHFPAQFIAEGVDQTRGWFYTLMILSTALFDKPAFLNCIVNGIVLAENGEKMSKRLKNYPEPDLIIDKYGADSLRYYLLTSPVMKAEDICFSEKGVNEVYKKFITILLNILSFYKMYEDKTLPAKVDSDNILDRWIIAKLQNLLIEVTKEMNNYDLVLASRPIQDFITDFSTWYLRRSRERFKGRDEDDKKQAFQILKYVLKELAKIIAPFTPFLAEKIYQDVDGPKESVHLENWPEVQEKLIDKTLLEKMEIVRKIVEAGLAARATAGIKVRQPLQKLKIKNLKLKIEEFEDLIKDELNIKEIKLVKDIKEEKGWQIVESEIGKIALKVEITPKLRQEGLFRELVRQINALRKEMGLTIKDRVVINYESKDKELKEVIKKFNHDLARSVLADKIKEEKGEKELKIDNKAVRVKIVK